MYYIKTSLRLCGFVLSALAAACLILWSFMALFSPWFWVAPIVFMVGVACGAVGIKIGEPLVE